MIFGAFEEKKAEISSCFNDNKKYRNPLFFFNFQSFGLVEVLRLSLSEIEAAREESRILQSRDLAKNDTIMQQT